jgi:membrane-bound lytic murein transglycosylase D
MKYLFLPAVVFLAGCQTLSNQQSTDNDITATQIDTANPIEINQALLADENIDVIHPIADVDFALTDKDTLTENNIWPRIQRQLSFEIPEQKRLIAERNWYIKHPRYLKRVAKRAEPFLYYIVEELEKNNMPIEMALLPVVESAFDPFAYSHGRASGMWQFVPATGERFGMKQNWWY